MQKKMIGDAIKTARKNMGLTQQELADRIHVSKCSISKWEQGRNTIPMGEVTRICCVLGDYATPILHAVSKECSPGGYDYHELCREILKEQMLNTDPSLAEYLESEDERDVELFLVGCEFLSNAFDEISKMDGDQEHEMYLHLLRSIISRYLDTCADDLKARMELYECLQDELKKIETAFDYIGYKLTLSLKPKDAFDMAAKYAEEDGDEKYGEYSAVLGRFNDARES